MLYIVKTKACPRCGGDLSLESDGYGRYFTCIQCGASLSEDVFSQAMKSLPLPPPKVAHTINRGHNI